MKKLFLGIEIGASKHQVAIGDAESNILASIQGKVNIAEGANGILEWMNGNIPSLLASESNYSGKVEAIGVGFGGIIESETGKSLASVQVSGWKDFNLKDWFENEFQLPSVIINDTVAAGLGEYKCGSGQGAKCFFYTNIGSGIGGVFIFEGKCYDGIGYGAAYFGHTFIPDWTSNIPGAICKVEDTCSGFGIERRLRTAGYVPSNSSLMQKCNSLPNDITCHMLGDAAREGDTFALEEIGRIAQSYAIGLSNVITLLSPDRVSIGGGVAKMGDLLLKPIRKYTDKLAFISSKGRYEIVQSQHGDAAVLVGAVVAAAENRNIFN